jgi:Uma2 family endonuclease
LVSILWNKSDAPIFRIRSPPDWTWSRMGNRFSDSPRLAVEIASSIVYRSGFERDFEEDVKDYAARMFA